MTPNAYCLNNQTNKANNLNQTFESLDYTSTKYSNNHYDSQSIDETCKESLLSTLDKIC